jgi:serine/threonine-protein kinase
MSPEQIRGEAVTAATDVYALGCVLCQCLTGAPPFADRQGMRVLWAQLQDEPPDPTVGIDGVAPALGPAILRALEKDRDKRPQSASEYARSLYEAAGLTPPAAPE